MATLAGRFIFEAWQVYQITNNNSPLNRTSAAGLFALYLLVRARSADLLRA
jgi:hypothetical protein